MVTKTMIDDNILQAMLEQSQYAHPQEEPEFWFSRGNQKKMVFEIGIRLMTSEEMTAEEAITMAQDYVDTFYATILSPSGWKKD